MAQGHVVHSHVDGEYVARMENVLDLYAETQNPARPLVCFDETPIQLIGEVRQPVPAQPGQRERYDYEYRRNGTANLFVTFDPHRGWRNVKVTVQAQTRCRYRQPTYSEHTSTMAGRLRVACDGTRARFPPASICYPGRILCRRELF
ncbi:hypothetical protein ABIC07_009090 [Bradyrhizobium sp. RT9a]